MKLTRLICVIALAAAVGACGNDDNGGGGDGGTGGTGGTAGTGGGGGGGGTVTDACVNAADEQVISDAGDGDPAAGRVAISDQASDCIFSDCPAEAAAVIGAEGLDPVANQALADCVQACTGNFYDLSNACLSCYGGSVSCGAANCTERCNDPDAQQCTDCRCNLPEAGNVNGVNCITEFEDCAGIPSTDTCS